MKMRKVLISFLILSLFISLIDYNEIVIKAKTTENAINKIEDRVIPGSPDKPSSWQDKWSGEYIYFGNWQKQYSDRKPIKWRVLENDGRNLLLMTDESVGTMPYHAEDDYASSSDYTNEEENTWEKATLRKWLNNDFYQNAFTEDERNYLVTNKVLNGFSSDSQYNSGPTTYDKVYLLSTKELEKSSYGFWGSGGEAASRQFVETTASGSYYEEVWTRTMATVYMVMGVGNPYAYWVNSKGQFISRGSWMTSAASWSKNVHPVIKIPIDCPYWSNEDPTVAEDSDESSGNSAGNGASESGKFSLKGLDFDMTLPDDIPVIGGCDINMDFAKLPIEFDMKNTEHGAEFRGAIGIKGRKKSSEDDSEKGLWNLKPDEWDGVKKWAESMDEKFIKGNLALMDARDKVNSRIKEGKSAVGGAGSAWSSKIKISASGFVEGTIESGKVRSLGGGIWVKMSFKTEKKWQCFVVQIPVVVKAEVGIGFDEKISLGVDLDAASIYAKGDMKVEFPSAKLSVGVGVAYIADVSVYGSLKNTIKIETGKRGASKRDNLTGTVSGEMGVSASALCFSVEKTLLDGKWEYYNEQKGGFQAAKLPWKKAMKFQNDTYQLNQVDFINQSSWYTKDGVNKLKKASSGQNNTVVLQSGIYSDPGVKMVTTEDGVTMMVYVADIQERSAGNHTAVVYSIYDDSNRTWSVPKILEDDGTADFYPDIITDGTDIYVAWTNSNRADFSDSVELPKMAESCEISVAKYDTKSATFTVSTLTSNDTTDIKPIFGKVNDQIGLVWLNNTDNDVLDFAGTNSLYYSLYQQEKWSESVQYVSCENNIINSYAIGTLQDGQYIAFITDSRDDVISDDEGLYVGKLTEKATLFDTDIPAEQGVQFTVINNIDLLTWYGDDTLAYSRNLVDTYSLLQNAKLSSEYQIISSGKTGILLFCACDQTTEQDGTDVYMCISEKGSYFSQPVKITDGGAYIGSYTAYMRDGEYHLIYSKDDVTFQDGQIQKSTDLCQKEVGSFHSLSLEEITYDETLVKPGTELPVKILVRNNGLVKENKIHVLIQNGDQILYDKNVDSSIEIGSCINTTIKVPLPEDILQHASLQFSVNPVNAENIDGANNKQEIRVGKSDLALYLEVDDDKKEVNIRTINESAFATDATLRVRALDENGTILKVVNLGKILGNDEIETKLTVAELLGGDISGAVYFEVVSDDEEIFQSNNFSYRYLEKFSNTSTPTPTPVNDIVGSIYTWRGEFTGWGGPDSYPSSANHEQGSGDENFYYEDLTSIAFSCGYACGLELMNPYNPAFTGADNEMAQFIKKMTNPRIKVTLQNGGEASSWNWDTELSFPSGQEVALPDGYLDNGYFALFGNDDVIIKVEIYDVRQNIGQSTATPRPTGTAGSSTTQSPNETGNADNTGNDGNIGSQDSNQGQEQNTVKNPVATKTKKIKKPGKVTGLDLSYEGKKLFVSWNWKSNVSGFQIQYAQNKKFTKKKKTKNTGKYAQDKTIRGLKKGKTYYVRIRAYKKASSKKVYGKWSKVKKVRTK